MASNVNKKAAHAGQWQTPPTMPRYPTLPSLNSSQSQSQAAMRSIAASPSQQEELVDLPPAPDKLPDTSEEYAKALQEAYRKGAAAAIKAQQDRIPTATSCPNFSTSLATSSGGINLPGHEIRIPTVDEEFSVSDAVSNLDHKILSSSVPDRSLMPPPPPHSSAVPVCIHSQQQNSVRGSDHQRSDLNPQMAQDNSPFSMYKCTDDGNCSNMNFALEETETETTINKNVPKKSLSMPDMTTYTKEAEEEKRLKRLARNRASARQRRLRKKNLVSFYLFVFTSCVLCNFVSRLNSVFVVIITF